MKNISFFKKNKNLVSRDKNYIISSYIQTYFLLKGNNLIFFFYLKNYFFKFILDNKFNFKVKNLNNFTFNKFFVFFMKFGKKLL